MLTFNEFANRGEVQNHLKAIEHSLTQLDLSMSELDTRYGFDTKMVRSIVARLNEHWQDKQAEIIAEINPYK